VTPFSSDAGGTLAEEGCCATALAATITKKNRNVAWGRPILGDVAARNNMGHLKDRHVLLAEKKSHPKNTLFDPFR
jgi:hypothetical protein